MNRIMVNLLGALAVGAALNFQISTAYAQVITFTLLTTITNPTPADNDGFGWSVAAVAHAVDAHDADLVGNFVNHAVVAHADAPVVFASGQLATAGRARIRRQCLNRRDDAGVNLR